MIFEKEIAIQKVSRLTLNPKDTKFRQTTHTIAYKKNAGAENEFCPAFIIISFKFR